MTQRIWFVALTLVACGGKPSTTADANPAVGALASPLDAEAAFWAAMTGTNFDALPSVITTLSRVNAADPTNERNNLILGGAHFWRTTEATRLGASAVGAETESAPLLIKYFSEVLMADAHNASASSALGSFLYATASLAADAAAGAAQTTHGKALMAQAIVDAPEAGLLTRADVYASAPLGSDDLNQADADLWQLLELCGDQALDRTTPDFSGYLAAVQASSHNKARCSASARSPHNLEGILVLQGDILVKQNKLDTAKVFYSAAQSLPTYANWPYKNVGDDRLSADLTARLATYSDPDSTKWAAILAPNRPCAICHSASAP